MFLHKVITFYFLCQYLFKKKFIFLTFFCFSYFFDDTFYIERNRNILFCALPKTFIIKYFNTTYSITLFIFLFIFLYFYIIIYLYIIYYFLTQSSLLSKRMFINLVFLLHYYNIFVTLNDRGLSKYFIIYFISLF